ncbi:hypothetical protein Syun_005254 [Stephania yunnanensis]|uniref:Fe2OG dioxygenase domain-containing protein n=1 Tax=Stephania yunnanensis TaxID=152371 RepID=A0AAP0L4E1_9MAGN
MGEVDLAFIQDEAHRPKLSITESDGIPVIDLSILNTINEGHYDSIKELVTQIGDACREWGFFQVINHGVPTDLLNRAFSASKQFFSLAIEEKRKVCRDEVNPLGYYDTEHTKNVRDWKEVFDFTVENPTFIPASPELGDQQLQELRNQWPKFPPELRETCEEYVVELEKLSYKLLELISMSLGLPAKRFNDFFKNQTSFVRLNHYPPCPAPELALGVGRHKDAGALTVLLQDEVGGLDVKRKRDGEWYRVKPITDSFIVNVGDIIQVWSNERYESVEHRVSVKSGKERFSIPFFFNPAHDAMVKPLDELTDDQNLPKYREYNWGKFFKTRKLSNFKKLNLENIQIQHFKIAN